MYHNLIFRVTKLTIFKPRAVFMAVMPLGATTLSEHGCTLFSQNIQTVPIISFIVSPDESWGYLGFSTVTPPQRFPFGRDNLKNILVRTFKFGMWVYMGNATNAIVL